MVSNPCKTIRSEQFTRQRVRSRGLDPNVAQITCGDIGPRDMHGMKIFGLAHHLPRLATRLFEQNPDRATDHRILNLALVTRDQRLQALQPVIGGVPGPPGAVLRPAYPAVSNI